MRSPKKIKKQKSVRRKINSDKIYSTDWLKYKFYKPHLQYDKYYVGVANDLLSVLKKRANFFKQLNFGNEQFKRLALLLTNYFEDYINDIGIWSYFIQTNKELYGKEIPLIEFPNPYDSNYINSHDIAFLFWFFLNQTVDNIFNPNHAGTKVLSMELFFLLETKIDDAPTSDVYKQFFTIEEDVHFFELKNRLKWFTFKNYIPGFEFTLEMKEAVEEFAEENQKLMAMHGAGIAYGIEDDFLYIKRSSFSALSSLEWFAGVAICSDSLKEAIKKIQERVMSTFLFEGHDKKYYHFKQSQTDIPFLVHKDSVNINLKKIKKGELCSFSVIKWAGDWWLSGIFMQTGMPSKQDLEEFKNNFHDIPFYAYSQEQQKQLWDITNNSHQNFLDYFGAPLVLFSNKTKLQKELDQFWKYNNDKNKKTDVDTEFAIEKFEKNQKKFWENFDYSDDAIALCSIEKQGISFSDLVPDVIQTMKRKSITKKEADRLFYYFFMDDIPSQITRYLLKHYPTHNLNFSVFPEINIAENAEFFLRYYAPNEFGNKPPNMRIAPDSMK